MSAVSVGAQQGLVRPWTLLRAGSRRWRSFPASLRVGLLLFGGAILLAIAGKLVMVDPLHQDLRDTLAKPGSAGHLLGTDVLGHDILSWIASSVGVTLLVGAAVVMLSTLVGVAIGLLAGYRGGVADAVLMRIVDLQLAVPPLLLFLAASASIDIGTTSLVLLISAVSWVPYARLVRTKILVERQRTSIAAARLAGVARRRILLRHLLPSVGTTALVWASLQLGFVMLWEATLSFFGLGIQPPATSLGFLIAEGRTTLSEAWWVVSFPGAMLAMLLLAANLVGDGLQELFGVEVEVIDH